MSAAPLTPNLQRCRDFILAFTARNGVAPTYREIANGLAMGGTHTAHVQVTALVQRGHARRLIGRKRGVQIITGICPTCGHVGS